MTTRRTRNLTHNERLRSRLDASQKDPAAGAVILRIRLTGALADVWRTLRDAAEGTGLSDSDILGKLLIAAVRTVRQSLRRLLREA